MGLNELVYWKPPKDVARLKVAEPFKIKSIEPIRQTTRAYRRRILQRARYNLFNVSSRDIFLDFLTDSGTGAMSQSQWAALQQGDESYAGSVSFDLLRDTVRDLFGFKHVLPSHQGRSAELVLMSHFISKKGLVVPGNLHFDTTGAHIEFQGGVIKEFPDRRIADLDDFSLFKGDIDLKRFAPYMEKNHRKIPLVVLTATCNSGGGQPVSLANVAAVGKICRKHRIPLFIDSARIIENAYFIKTYEPGYSRKSIRTILREFLSHADGAIMSAKKDGLVNIGGFIATNNEEYYENFRRYTILFDGFITYGGLAGRDLAAIAVGLREATDLDYLRYRISQAAYLATSLWQAGVRVVLPPGGHAVYIDARAFCPHLPVGQYPGHALTLALYLESGIRSCEIGTLLRGRDPQTGEDRTKGLDLLRLAIPRRVYSYNQLDYVIDAILQLKKNAHTIRGVKFVREAPFLRHFTSEFALI
ncbi:MAG: tyrosine phenol-lyase [Chloroflexi bacterium]|nr:MAG: tyrosine phenol-lyase [Chloroflexota bacterium]